MVPATQTDGMEAHVTAKNPGFAKALYSQLAEHTASNGAVPELRASPAPPRISFLMSPRRISSRKVLISWKRPARLVWLNFGPSEIAKRVSEKFKSGEYTIFGRIVDAAAPTGSGFRQNPVPWSVRLQDVPYNATKTDVESAIKAPHDKPRHIELGKISNDFDVGAAPTFVESLPTQLGPVKFTFREEASGKRYKGVAVFSDDSAAREAVLLLHNQPQSFLNNDKLTLQLMSSAKLRSCRMSSMRSNSKLMLVERIGQRNT
jgi:hypothetical protein